MVNAVNAVNADAQFFLAYEPQLYSVGHPRLFVRTLASVLPLAAIVSVPQVAAFIGIRSAVALGILGVWTAWIGVSSLYLGPRFARARAAFFWAVYGNLFMCIGTALALVLSSGNPHSLLWLGYVLYSCINATLPTRNGRRFLMLCHALAPFLLTPVFLHLGQPLTRSITGPLLASVFSVIGFAYLSAVADVGLELQREHEAALARLREQEGELERQRIARELHDSLGSTLSLVGMYADLVEHHARDPQELRRVSGVVREAAGDGLTDLRGLLSALAPHTTSLSSLGSALRRLADRAGTLGGARVELELASDADGARVVPGGLRLALVRCFQEAVRNALRHGAAKHVQGRLALEGNGVELTLRDDGSGIQGTADEGRGLVNMRARAQELAGRFTVESEPGRGTRVSLWLPLTLSHDA